MSGRRRTTRVVLAFAATGKTYAAERCPDRVLDMVAMPYKYHLPEGEVTRKQAEASKGTFLDGSTWNDEWPRNYVDAVEREADSGKWAYILCPSDPFVLDALAADGREVFVLAPEADLKEEYRQRFIDRGSVALVGHLIDGGAWERALGTLKSLCELHAEAGRNVHFSTLGSGQYLLQIM